MEHDVLSSAHPCYAFKGYKRLNSAVDASYNFV